MSWPIKEANICNLSFQANLIHLGAKYAPCMRWDEVLDREIREERLKERDTACCIRKDRAGCVQSPKTECSKYGDPTGSTPRSNWVCTTYYQLLMWLLTS